MITYKLTDTGVYIAGGSPRPLADITTSVSSLFEGQLLLCRDKGFSYYFQLSEKLDLKTAKPPQMIKSVAGSEYIAERPRREYPLPPPLFRTCLIPTSNMEEAYLKQNTV